MENQFKPQRLNKLELASRFYVDGKECITSAEILFEDKTRGVRSQYGILLIHGIELLLKSYLLVNNHSLSDDPKKIDKYLIKNLRHKFIKIYNKCLKYDKSNTLNDPILKSHLDFLRQAFYEDSVGVRYVVYKEILAFDPKIFFVIKKYLVKTVHELFFPNNT
jgi:hypothetical protein